MLRSNLLRLDLSCRHFMNLIHLSHNLFLEYDKDSRFYDNPQISRLTRPPLKRGWPLVDKGVYTNNIHILMVVNKRIYIL